MGPPSIYSEIRGSFAVYIEFILNITMKFLLKNFLSVVLLSTVSLTNAAVDSEGYPEVYLRGTVNGWSAVPNYKFQRSGDLYQLVITPSNPVTDDFKIADEDWRFDFGAYESGQRVESSISLPLKAIGLNIYGNFEDAIITFTYNPYMEISELVVNFMIDGQPIPEPEPEPVPDPSDKISGTLPVMYINVYADADHTRLNNEVIDYDLAHKDYFKYAEYWLDTNDCEWMEDLGAKSVGSAEEPLPLQIKARGNWTRTGFSKKPFKLKLDKKQNLLGLTPDKSKHYALLAHADDTNGYLRNFTSFNLGERIGLPWTPKMQPVELVINGDYRGLYFLTESIRVEEGRVNITEQNDNETDKNLVSGGYIVELDNYDEENQIQMEELSCTPWQHCDLLRISWDTPEVYSDLQKRFITDQFSAINQAIGSNSDETWSYLDLDDAARYYLVEEITGHTESYHGSTYLYRDWGEGEKWHFTPLWDAGNAFRAWENTFLYDCDPFGNTWISSMRENRMFNDKVKETWLWFMQKRYYGVEDDILEYAGRITDACQYDYSRWANEYVPWNGQAVADNRDMNSRAQDVLWYLGLRTAWLKTVFGDYTMGDFGEPARDTTPAAELPEYAKPDPEDYPVDPDDPQDPDNPDNPDDPKDPEIPDNPDDSNAIDSIKADPSAIEFYNLQGQRVANPQKGQIYIVRYAGRTVKMVW